MLQPLMTAHPDYSGNLKYPIPHPTMAARDAYMDAYNLWDIDTAYGRTRREWCKWLADRLEEKYILGDKQ
ncbi:MAG: hypothetical protein GY810_32435 [Aureispira sp.]|nr:hypothetical protein [Aureispira sp.]